MRSTDGRLVDERYMGLAIMVAVVVTALLVGRFHNRLIGAWILFGFGLLLLADELLAGPYPWHWGLAGAALAGLGLRDLWTRLSPADRGRTSASS